MQPNLRLRQVVRLAVAIGVTLVAGTIAFHSTLRETWLQSFYRTVVTATLAGLDTVPRSDGSRIISIVLVLCGLTIIAYAGAVIVQAIANGVFTSVLAERRKADDRTPGRPLHHLRLRARGPPGGRGVRART